MAVCLGLLRFTLDVVYPRPGCGALDDRPAVLAMVHPYYYITLQLGVGTLLTVVISLLTKPIPRQQVRLFFYFFIFSTGLVRLYIAGLPLRSCPDYWATFSAEGVPQCPFFVSCSSRIRTQVLIITKRMP